jgi:membrane fusion protein (multidrug efflux system)
MQSALAYILAICALAAAYIFGYSDMFAESVDASAPASGTDSATPVVVTRVLRAPFVDTLEALGSVHANESVDVTSNRADHVAKIHFEDGQHVEAGDLLVELFAQEEHAQLQEAIAMRDDRLINYNGSKTLFEQSLISERDFEATKALSSAAQARVRSLEAAIADRRIVAPFGGVLGLRRISVGAYLQPSTVITTLDDLEVVKLDFTIPETWLAHVSPGMKIAARSDAWPELPFSGEIVTIATRLDARTRSATVRARLANPDLKLRPGMLLKVSIDRGQQTVLQVPEEALLQRGHEHMVFRIDVDGMAESVSVEIGRRRVGAVEITDGLDEGDRVVTVGVARVRDGAAVEIVKTAVLGL